MAAASKLQQCQHRQGQAIKLKQFILAFLLQGGAPLAGVVITDDGLQWYNGTAQALVEASAEVLTEGEAAQWMARKFCTVRCSVHLYAEVMHPSRLAKHILTIFLVVA